MVVDLEPGSVEDARRHGQVVGHELAELHVDALGGRDKTGVAHRGAQQALHPVDPVLGKCVGVDLHAPQPVSVGEHSDRRLQHGDGIAQGEGDGGVGEGGEQRAELLEVLGCLEHPAIRSPQITEHLEFAAQKGVVASLVEAQVVVAPPRHTRVPLERVGAQVEVDELAVLLDAPRWPVVHDRRQRRRGQHHLVVRRRPLVAGIDAIAPRAVAQHGRRLDHLPPRHRAKP